MASIIYRVLFLLSISTSLYSIVYTLECLTPEEHAQGVKKCCLIPNPFDVIQTPEMVGSIEKCVSEFGELKGERKRMCTYHCQTSLLQLVNKTAVNRAKFLNMIKSAIVVGGKAREEVMAIATECLNQAPMMARAITNHSLGCNPLAYMLDECIMSGLYYNCPDEFWKKDEICDHIAERYAVCS
ncbi:uncharacterized protein LOC129755235 [Uranotaenia lowii]|uniref:uncharacterized protein LOC129755235 n=1 Tax=Uranotaenia lowii TaxID=190385 RepID=UPI00247AD0ED|nr:uncharacterized protein LOC129755235 [Uranotaenia lowii]